MLRLFIATAVSLCLACCATVRLNQVDLELRDPSQLISNDQKVFYLRTRFIVEVMGDIPARSYTEIAKDIWYAEMLFEQLGIKFVIVEMAIASPNQNWNDYKKRDASEHQNEVNIYYTYSKPSIRKGPNIIGLANFPWEDGPHAIFINGPYSDRSTLVHELGHYLGLYHTFGGYADENDFVKDTLSPSEYADEKSDSPYENYNNIMNYHWYGTNSFVTEGQIDRMRHYLLTSKNNVVISEAIAIPEKVKTQETEKEKDADKSVEIGI